MTLGESKALLQQTQVDTWDNSVAVHIKYVLGVMHPAFLAINHAAPLLNAKLPWLEARPRRPAVSDLNANASEHRQENGDGNRSVLTLAAAKTNGQLSAVSSLLPCRPV